MTPPELTIVLISMLGKLAQLTTINFLYTNDFIRVLYNNVGMRVLVGHGPSGNQRPRSLCGGGTLPIPNNKWSRRISARDVS